jgi:hypothetical protein
VALEVKDRKVWGEEADALVAVREAVAQTRAVLAGSPEKKTNSLVRLLGQQSESDSLRQSLASYLDTLAWASAWNGLLAEARAASAEAYRLSGQSADYAGYRDAVEALCAELEAGAEDQIAALEAGIAASEAEAWMQRSWEFEDSVDRFLFDTLVRFEAKMGAFTDQQAGTLINARWRLDWAQQVEALTLGHPKARVTWAAARAAIAKADGVVASALYAEVPIDLKPQQGLVPIGMNPVTKLWEFYHLRSAWDPRSGQDPAEIEIPEHDPETGRIAVGEATGIVFVLIPGGTFTMGAQSRDRDGPNYDPQALESEAPPQDVMLSPYFLARHELTQAQWVRLSADGVNPSRYGAGFRAGGMDAAVDGAHPVETVDWSMCVDLLRLHGLLLPTEAQWEYGARAGTSTVWWSGDEVASLERAANVLDQRAKRSHRGRGAISAGTTGS